MEQLMTEEKGSPFPKVARKKVKLSSNIFVAMEESGCLEGEQVFDSESVHMEDIKTHQADGTRDGGYNGGSGNIAE